MIADKKIKVLFNSTVAEIREREVSIKTEKEELINLPNSYVFIFAGGEPPFPLMQNIGIQFGGELKT